MAQNLELYYIIWILFIARENKHPRSKLYFMTKNLRLVVNCKRNTYPKNDELFSTSDDSVPHVLDCPFEDTVDHSFFSGWAKVSSSMQQC